MRRTGLGPGHGVFQEASGVKVFRTGVSGYIGGSVAAHLAAAGHQVSGPVRSQEKAAALRRFGIEPVLGTLDDAGVLSQAAKAADVVVNAACRSQGSAVALLDALAGSGKPFIHTSGSSVIGTRPRASVPMQYSTKTRHSRHRLRVCHGRR